MAKQEELGASEGDSQETPEQEEMSKALREVAGKIGGEKADKNEISVEGELSAEVLKLESNLKGLGKEIEGLPKEDLEELDEKEKVTIYDKTKILVGLLATVTAIPLVASILSPEIAGRVRGIMDNVDGAINNNIGTMFAGLGVLVSICAVQGVREYLQNRKEGKNFAGMTEEEQQRSEKIEAEEELRLRRERKRISKLGYVERKRISKLMAK